MAHTPDTSKMLREKIAALRTDAEILSSCGEALTWLTQHAPRTREEIEILINELARVAINVQMITAGLQNKRGAIEVLHSLKVR